MGATTLDEYRKYIEKDAALERRFQKVLVDEPSVEDTIAILRGLQEKYEAHHHGVDITDRRLSPPPTLSHRYITDRFPAGQGHRPDRRSRQPHQDGNRLQAGIRWTSIRRMIQLKIEREAAPEEQDAASAKRLACSPRASWPAGEGEF